MRTHYCYLIFAVLILAALLGRPALADTIAERALLALATKARRAAA